MKRDRTGPRCPCLDEGLGPRRGRDERTGRDGRVARQSPRQIPLIQSEADKENSRARACCLVLYVISPLSRSPPSECPHYRSLSHSTLQQHRPDNAHREGDVAQWLERLTASPVMHASRLLTPLFQGGVFRETALFLPSQCDWAITLMAASSI